MTDSVPRRELPRLLAAATGLSARSAPGTTLAYGLGEVIAGLLPVAAAWLFKLLLDDLADHQGPASLTGPALALAGLGAVAAVLPLAARYLRGQLDRAVGLLALDRLYQAMNRMAGIARMEDPAFRDRLRMAQEACRPWPVSCG
jgi:ATP-binding cassette subfamily B protein